ncbi:MAG: chromate transporter [Bacteroidales bacterium]|jgi:chromate transporter|nr:chromate transporter [Bacteroidales bacterium]
MEIYLTLFWVFFKISLFSFGGGYAIISLMQHEIVDNYNWLSINEFADVVAISQSTPGAISINAATYVGYVAAGNTLGAIVATVALCLPSILIMLLLCIFFMKMKNNKYMEFALNGLRPAVIGVIAAAVLQLTNKDIFIDYRSIIIGILAFFAYFKFNPIWIFLLSGIAGWIMY